MVLPTQGQGTNVPGKKNVASLELVPYNYLIVDGTKYILRPGSTAIGSAFHCNNITIPCRFVSQYHAIVTVSADGRVVNLVDINSTFGTRLNGNLLMSNVPYTLNTGDVFYLAFTRVKLVKAKRMVKVTRID